MKIPNRFNDGLHQALSLARIVSEDSQRRFFVRLLGVKSSKDS